MAEWRRAALAPARQRPPRWQFHFRRARRPLYGGLGGGARWQRSRRRRTPRAHARPTRRRLSHRGCRRSVWTVYGPRRHRRPHTLGRMGPAFSHPRVARRRLVAESGNPAGRRPRTARRGLPGRADRPVLGVYGRSMGRLGPCADRVGHPRPARRSLPWRLSQRLGRQSTLRSCAFSRPFPTGPGPSEPRGIGGGRRGRGRSRLPGRSRRRPRRVGWKLP